MKTHALFALLLLTPPALANGFGDWAAVVVAGDSYSEDQKDTAVFDNGRQTIVQELKGIGFQPNNIRQFTDWPQRFHDAERSTPKHIAKGLADVAKTARAGCMVYLTSHGNQDGIGIGDYVLSPKRLGRMIDTACSKRPAVVIVSACYSGVFVDRLRAPDRIVFTAAAKDRSSFGCGATDKYTYFDTCAVENLPKAGDFVTFGKRTIACVAAREKKEQVDRASNPQLVVGEKAAAVVPHWGH
jgi:Glycosylphosphatidylinositol transamidase (GPIT), subunit GPI8